MKNCVYFKCTYLGVTSIEEIQSFFYNAGLMTNYNDLANFVVVSYENTIQLDLIKKVLDMFKIDKYTVVNHLGISVEYHVESQTEIYLGDSQELDDDTVDITITDYGQAG